MELLSHPPEPPKQNIFFKRSIDVFLFKQGMGNQGTKKLAQSSLRKHKVGKKKSIGVNEALRLKLSPRENRSSPMDGGDIVVANVTVETSELSWACAFILRHLGF